MQVTTGSAKSEVLAREFKQLCIESRIARHLTVAMTPQQNGLAELSWIRSPSRAIDKMAPMKMCSGHPSDYEMLMTFRCVSQLHVKQGKPEPKAVKCVLLKYPGGVNGYKLYRLDNKSPKIVTSRNVVFNESVMYKDILKDSGASTDKSVEELQEDGDDEDARDQEIDYPSDLTDYQLVQDREPRKRTKPL
nr:retrotransposon protein, putative, Ty1-copia subclass [Tanacetum cinerariifolium]